MWDEETAKDISAIISDSHEAGKSVVKNVIVQLANGGCRKWLVLAYPLFDNSRDGIGTLCIVKPRSSPYATAAISASLQTSVRKLAAEFTKHEVVLQE